MWILPSQSRRARRRTGAGDCVQTRAPPLPPPHRAMLGWLARRTVNPAAGEAGLLARRARAGAAADCSYSNLHSAAAGGGGGASACCVKGAEQPWRASPAASAATLHRQGSGAGAGTGISRGFASEAKGPRAKGISRGLASEAKGPNGKPALPPLKDAMKSLLLKVHPDLFTTMPDAREAGHHTASSPQLRELRELRAVGAVGAEGAVGLWELPEANLDIPTGRQYPDEVKTLKSQVVKGGVVRPWHEVNQESLSTLQVGPHTHCSPRHPPPFETSCLELHPIR